MLLRIKENNQLDRGEYIFLSLYLIIMTVEIGIEYYSGQGIGWALILFRGTSLLTPLFALELLLSHPPRLNTYCSAVCIYFLILLALSLPIYYIQNTNVSIFSATIYFAIPLGVSLECISLQKLNKPFLIICLIGIFCFLSVWFFYDIDFTKAMRRFYTWSDIFFWAGVFWAIIPVMLYLVIFDCSRMYLLLAIGYWLSGIIFNLIFVKRFIIVDSILLLIMIGVFLFCDGRINAKVFFNSLLLLGLVVLVLHLSSNSVIESLWDAVVGRFEDTSVAEFDRFEESRIYFRNIDPIYLFFGKGLWGGHSSFGTLHEALHVGWSNLIHKGGIVLFLFALLPTIKAFILLPNMKKLDLKTKWAVCMACVYGFRLFYTNMHAHYPEMMMVFFSYAIIMNYTKETKPNKESKYIR